MDIVDNYVDFQKLSTTCWLFCWFFWWPASIINSQNPFFATVYIPLYIVFHVSHETFLIISYSSKEIGYLRNTQYPDKSTLLSFRFHSVFFYCVFLRYSLFPGLCPLQSIWCNNPDGIILSYSIIYNIMYVSRET